MDNYRMAVEFLLGRIEDLIDAIQENEDYCTYEEEIEAINKRIQVVRKYEK